MEVSLSRSLSRVSSPLPCLCPASVRVLVAFDFSRRAVPFSPADLALCAFFLRPIDHCVHSVTVSQCSSLAKRVWPVCNMHCCSLYCCSLHSSTCPNQLQIFEGYQPPAVFHCVARQSLAATPRALPRTPQPTGRSSHSPVLSMPPCPSAFSILLRARLPGLSELRG